MICKRILYPRVKSCCIYGRGKIRSWVKTVLSAVVVVVVAAFVAVEAGI